MKREAFVLIVALFLIVFMIGGVSAETKIISSYQGFIISQYKVDSGCVKINSSTQNGVKIDIESLCWNTYFPNDEYKALIEPFSVNPKITIDGKVYSQNKNDTTERGYLYLCGNNSKNIEIEEIMERSGTYVTYHLISAEGDVLNINLDIYLNSKNNDGYGQLTFEGILIENSSYEKRISALESWQQSINNTIITLQNSITSILNTLTGHNTRISTLENSTSNGTTIINNTTIIMNNGNNPYLNYLSSSQRKSMVCGYAEDNSLTTLNDLGWNCTITYKTTRGRTTSTCKCKAS